MSREKVLVYFTGPLFTMGEQRFMRDLANALHQVCVGQYIIFLPQESQGALNGDMHRAYTENSTMLNDSDVVVANCDGSIGR